MYGQDARKKMFLTMKHSGEATEEDWEYLEHEGAIIVWDMVGYDTKLVLDQKYFTGRGVKETKIAQVGGTQRMKDAKIIKEVRQEFQKDKDA